MSPLVVGIFLYSLRKLLFLGLVGLGYYSEQAFEAMHADIKVIMKILLLHSKIIVIGFVAACKGQRGAP